MENMTTRRKRIKSQAKKLVFDYYFIWLVPIVLSFLLSYVFSRNYTNSQGVTVSISLLGNIFALVLGVAMVKFYLALVRDPEKVSNHLWEALKYSFSDNLFKRVLYVVGKHLILSCVSLLYIVPMLFVFIDQLSNIYKILPLFTGEVDPMMGVNNPEIVEALGSVISSLIVFAIIISLATFFISLVIAPFDYIIQDNLSKNNRAEAFGFIETLKVSYALMKGHMWEYILLHLSLIGWVISCILIVPLFFVIPYYSAIIPCWMDDLMKQNPRIKGDAPEQDFMTAEEEIFAQQDEEWEEF